MGRLRVAVIGVGHLGRFHAEKFAQMEDAELVAVVDIVEERAKKVAKRLGVKWFTNFEEVIPLVDAVSIVTPTVTHYEIAKRCAEEGRHLFVEKPVTEHPKTAKELIELARKKGVVLQVGHIERFQPPIKEMLKRVSFPLFIEAHRLSQFTERALDVDVVLDLMIHDIDLVLALNREVEVKALLAAGAPVLSEKLDIASARIVFENGCSANLTASRISLTPQRRFRVFEKGRYASADTISRTYFEIRLTEERRLVSRQESFEKADPLKEELRAFVKSVLEEREPPVSGVDALRALELAHRIKEEVEKNLRAYL